METTRIMPLHIGKGRTESRAISAIIDYVANPQKTDHGKLITCYECDSRVVDAEFMLAKRQYIAATGRVRGADDVIAYHVRQSFCPGEITPEEANRLGVEFAKRFTKGKHAFIVCGFGCTRIAVWAILYLRFWQSRRKVLDVDQTGSAQTTAFTLDEVDVLQLTEQLDRLVLGAAEGFLHFPDSVDDIHPTLLVQPAVLCGQAHAVQRNAV